MIRIILFILLLFSAATAHSADYIDYHKHIIVAEQQFLYYNTPSGAIKKYKEVFEKWERPFAKDCYIALQLACMMKDKENAIYFFEKCAETGVEWGTFMVSDYITDMLRDTDLSTKVADVYKTKRANYLAGIDTAYQGVVYRMFRKENELRRIAEGEGKRAHHLLSAWLRLEDSNMYALVKMIKKKGFPGENRVGYYFYKQADDNNRKAPEKDKYPDTKIYLSSHVATMFFHHRCGYQLLKDELMEAVKQGELHPREYALIYEWSHGYFMKPHWDDTFHVYDCRSGEWEKKYNFYFRIRPVFEHKDLNKVNKDRLEIGISTLDHDERKKKYAQENRLFLFFGMFGQV